jgi:hypothetical protein
MGSLFSLSHRQEGPESRQAINQIYNAEFGYAPVGPVGPVASVPKRYMYNNGTSNRHRRRRRH